jgi:D-alanyl-lipoteichoic acid acyltransferase DltB (MBOAT superfamily)
VLFNSPLYGVFLVACFAVFWGLKKARLPRALFLVAASYGFYFYGTLDAAREHKPPLGPFAWSVLCLGIIFVGSTIDFFVGRALGREQRPRARKALLLVSVIYYLGVLSVFKYFDFAVDAFADAAHALGWNVSRVHLQLVLPFGISFFTFETMSYTIDVYRRELPPAKKYLDYLLFVAFFPHLVAGPIVRPKEMLPQLAAQPRYDETEQSHGLFLIASGLAKKIAIGDFLAQNLVKRVFDNPERFSSIEVLVAVYAYAIEIYADFSGYTDVAIGSALLFGYRLPVNFNRPYVARNLQDFWHRWHISLSTWLRDYLYIPLGGSKKGSLLTYRNLMITMVLGGLWHGASWNFVIWGALHGVALAGTRMWQRWRARSGARNPPDPEGESAPLPSRRGAQLAHPGPWYAHGISVFCTFQYVCFAWIFFRAPTFAHAKLMIARIAVGHAGWANVSARVLAVMGVAFALHLVPPRISQRARDAFARCPAFVQGLALAAVALGLHVVSGAKAEPFVYGQF